MGVGACLWELESWDVPGRFLGWSYVTVWVYICMCVCVSVGNPTGIY